MRRSILINSFFGRPGVVSPALLAAGHVLYAKGLAGMFDFYSAANICDPVLMQVLCPADRHEDKVRARLQCTAFCIEEMTTIDTLVDALPFNVQVG